MSSESTTVILPLDLGAATGYDQNVFPLAYHHGRGDNFSKGSLLLSSTLEEMARIKELGLDLSTSSEFLFNTRVKYEALAAKKAKLQNKTFNPFKVFQNYRAARVFHAASLSLYLETKETSERMQRVQNEQREQELLQTVPSAELHAVDNSVPDGATIGGLAINLRGALDENAVRTIVEAANTIIAHASSPSPFVDDDCIRQLSDDDATISLAETASLLSRFDPSEFTVDGDDIADSSTSSELRRTDTTSPSSQSAVNHIHIEIRDSVLTTNSNAPGMTITNRGSHNHGASFS